jgi:hypothetical protein
VLACIPAVRHFIQQQQQQQQQQISAAADFIPLATQYISIYIYK